MARREPARSERIDLRFPARAPGVSLVVMFLLVGCNMPGIPYADVEGEHLGRGTCGHGSVVVVIAPSTSEGLRALEVEVTNLRDDDAYIKDWFVVHGDVPSIGDQMMSVVFRNASHHGAWSAPPDGKAGFLVSEREITRDDQLGNWVGLDFTYSYEGEGEPVYRVSCDIAGDGMADP